MKNNVIKRYAEEYEAEISFQLCDRCVFNHYLKWDCDKFNLKKEEAQFPGVKCNEFKPANSRYLACLCGAASADKNGTSQETAILLASTYAFLEYQNLFDSIGSQILRWYHNGVFTMDRIVRLSDDSTFRAIEALERGSFASGNTGTNEDSGHVLPLVFPISFFAPSNAGVIAREAAGIINSSEDALNAAEIFGDTVAGMLTGMSYRESLIKNAKGFRERIINHKNSENAFDVLGMIYDATSGDSFEKCMSYEMPVKQILGGVAGIEYRINGIPSETLPHIDAMPIICTVCSIFERLMTNC